MPSIQFQPKQTELLRLIKSGTAPVIGVGGGRGAAKSSGADRCVIDLMHEWPGMLGCIVMRNFDQVFKYHIEAIRRDFPWLESVIKTSMPANLKCGGSQLDFSYAENMDDIVRRFRSGNYDLIVIDQAEQFSGREIREIRKATRSKGGKQAKIVLLFNMRGSGIQDLRKWFHLHEVNKDEDPRDYVFLKVNPWDNVEWVRAALKEDGHSVLDYYRWTDAERKKYAAERGPYTRQLATDDEVIRKADWEGDWDSLEGAYFANTYDRESTWISPVTASSMLQDWDVRWMSTDWGKSHFCATLWHGRTVLSPERAKHLLGWDTTRALTATVTYREYIDNEKTSEQIGYEIGRRTREPISDYFLSPDAFGERDSPNTIAMKIGSELEIVGMPAPVPADTDRKGGYGLMGTLLANTKAHGMLGDDVWLISSNCPELLAAIPMQMRDPKDLDDVLKTDKGTAKIDQDVIECGRYGLKSYLNPKRTAPYLNRAREEAVKWRDPTTMAVKMREFELKEKKKGMVQRRWRAH